MQRFIICISDKHSSPVIQIISEEKMVPKIKTKQQKKLELDKNTSVIH